MSDIKTTKSKAEILEEILKEAKDMKELIVLGYDAEGSLHIKSSIQSFPFLHYTFNKAVFDANLIEQSFKNEAKKAA